MVVTHIGLPDLLKAIHYCNSYNYYDREDERVRDLWIYSMVLNVTRKQQSPLKVLFYLKRRTGNKVLKPLPLLTSQREDIARGKYNGILFIYRIKIRLPLDCLTILTLA